MPRIRRPLLALIVLVLAVAIGYGVNALRSHHASTPGPATHSSAPLTPLSSLPTERAGYYREYTVPTPGSSDRGARRIITGAHGEYYYTGDHYEHFVQIVVTR